MKNANSTEFDVNTPHPVISLVTEWDDYKKGKLKGDINKMGGTMRLGAQKCKLNKIIFSTCTLQKKILLLKDIDIDMRLTIIILISLTIQIYYFLVILATKRFDGDIRTQKSSMVLSKSVSS